MQVAVVIAPPRFGATVKSFDATAAKAMKGVTDVVQFKHGVREGVAVLATDYWSAKQARDAVKVEWDDSKAYTRSTQQMFADYKALAAKPGVEAKKTGDVTKAGAVRYVEADYEFPYLAHSAMEPMNCVAHITEGGCELWTGSQIQTFDQTYTAALLGIKPEQVKVNSLFAGGSFGRRANPRADYVQEAVSIAKAWGKGKPVKLVWSREDDTHGGMYRPAFFHSMKAGLDARGKLVSWQHRLVGQSILDGTPLMPPGAPVDPLSIEGAANLPYDVPNLLVDVHSPKSEVTVQWWRSVGSTHTAYATEAFLDDVARATKQDPVDLRRSLLAKHPHHLEALNLAAEKAGWGSPLAKGKARGVAVHESFGTVVAQVVEVAQVAPNKFKVERVVCAVHCGIALNPNILAMQVESSIGLGLGAIASGAITLKDGKVEQSNFHDYTVLRMNQMPAVEVHIVPSTDKPTGIGEPGLPPIGPAVAGAIAQLTGKPLHTLPFSRSGVSLV
jgi:isoquinoline 1-oxidoreductase beta subunit